MNEMSALKEYAFLVTSRFESRGYDSIQTKDKGIVSYGLHQATLASGSLEKIIKRYLKTSKTQTAIELEKYLPQIENKSSILRKDKNFKTLLQKAAKESSMKMAQISEFTESYWKPVERKLQELNFHSRQAAAVFYDTKIQGGFNKILDTTLTKFKGKKLSEHLFLKEFLKSRADYLNTIAKNKDSQTARLLQNSIITRISTLNKIVDEENKNLNR
ncbi:MAG: chitosanase [Proteobacteria bacterium]|nr:chitosanase [Pseudomonadota bacterium]